GAERVTKVASRASGEADFEERDAGDADETPLDPLGPLGCIRAGPDADQGGLVDEPVRHRQARAVTSGSARSATETSAGATSRSRVRVRRRYSVRERPSLWALMSMAAMTSSGTSRIRM